MVYAYKDYYLDDVKDILGGCIDYMINDCEFETDSYFCDRINI